MFLTILVFQGSMTQSSMTSRLTSMTKTSQSSGSPVNSFKMGEIKLDMKEAVGERMIV